MERGNTATKTKGIVTKFKYIVRNRRKNFINILFGWIIILEKIRKNL